MNQFNQRIIEEFRSNHGIVGGPFEGQPLLLLTTTGAKTKLLRTTPLIYLPDGDDLVVFASNGGSATPPAWYRNLLAHPRVTVEVADRVCSADAHELSGRERERLWNLQVAARPEFAAFQARTARRIPVIALTPLTARV